jgi:hypothetical protein
MKARRKQLSEQELRELEEGYGRALEREREENDDRPAINASDNELIASITITPKLERKLNYRLEHLKTVNADATINDLLELLLEGDTTVTSPPLISVSVWALNQTPPLSISYARRLAKEGRIKGAFFDADKMLNGQWLVPPDAVVSELSSPARQHREAREKRRGMKLGNDS